MMKDRWKNNLGLKIMAVLFAIGLWWTVVNVDNPVGTKKYTVNVQVTNTEVVTNTGKSYQILDNAKTVTVTVKARRKVLEEIKTSHISATADFREMQDNFVPIRIKIDGFEGAYEEAYANPQNIQIKTEDTEKKTFPITTTYTGTVRAGYVIGKLTAEPQTIDISGPKSSLGRISRVVARVDVSELSKDASLQAEMIYYDSADNILDQSLLSSNCDINGVTVKVELWKTKQVDVKLYTDDIQAGDGFAISGITVEPQQINIAGPEEVLKEMQYLEVKSDALKKADITQNEEIVVDITDSLPKEVRLVDETTSSIVVTITVEKVGTKSLLVPVRSIKVVNLSEDFELEYGPEQEVELQFEGSSDTLAGLTYEKVIATIDLSSCKEEDTYNIAVKVTDLPEQCTYVGDATVQIILKKK